MPTYLADRWRAVLCHPGRKSAEVLCAVLEPNRQAAKLLGCIRHDHTHSTQPDCQPSHAGKVSAGGQAAAHRPGDEPRLHSLASSALALSTLTRGPDDTAGGTQQWQQGVSDALLPHGEGRGSAVVYGTYLALMRRYPQSRSCATTSDARRGEGVSGTKVQAAHTMQPTGCRM